MLLQIPHGSLLVRLLLVADPRTPRHSRVSVADGGDTSERRRAARDVPRAGPIPRVSWAEGVICNDANGRSISSSSKSNTVVKGFSVNENESHVDFVVSS